MHDCVCVMSVARNGLIRNLGVLIVVVTRLKIDAVCLPQMFVIFRCFFFSKWSRFFGVVSCAQEASHRCRRRHLHNPPLPLTTPGPSSTMLHAPEPFLTVDYEAAFWYYFFLPKPMIFKCIIACLRRLLCKLNFLAYLCGIRDSLTNFQNLVTNLDFDFSVLHF